MTRTLAALLAGLALGIPTGTTAAPAPTPTPTPTQVIAFAPQGTVKAVRQVTVRFATPMVALGRPRLPDPFEIDCAAKGQGRWADGRHWIYDFAADLPAGLRCSFRLKGGLTDAAGRAVTAKPAFVFNTGGPAIMASLPNEGDEGIDENQVFLLKLDATATPESVAAHARCIVEGIGESIPVRVIDGEERRALLAQRRQLGYAYFRILWKDGDVATLRVRDPALEQAEAQLTALRCERRLPAGTAMQLVWGRGIAAAGGVATRSEQRLAFRVRPEFTARVECQRVNARAGCLPFKPVEVRFSAPVPRAQALALRLLSGDTTHIALAAAAAQTPMLEAIRFNGPFPPAGEVTVTLPPGLVDDSGRPLANANRFPLAVRIDEYPPLAKFAANFGILESREGGVLPVTLRNLDAPVAGAPAGIAAQRLRIGADAAAIGQWLRRVDEAMQPQGDWVDDPAAGEPRWQDETGARSVFTAADGATAFAVAKPAGAREFEVVGIALGEPGLHIVELESRRLGQSLLGSDRPRYVATAALVTNLAVHFKWGRESSLVWVTRLDDGQPVADAAVTINDYCDGRERWRGRTDRDGIARVATSFGEPVNGDYCGDEQRRPLLVTAAQGGDFSFALGSWTQGIAPWDFGLETGSGWDTVLQHTVLDRALFRPGETVSMKHLLRRHNGGGIGLDERLPGERKIVIAHQGSDQRYELKATFDAGGTATMQWTLPAGARLGDYGISIEDAAGRARPSGQFKVEDFRLPTLRASVTGPAQPLVRPQSVPLDLHIAWLAGGGAGGLPVVLRTYVEEQPAQFTGYEDWQFGGAAVREGVSMPGSQDDAADDDGEDARPEPRSLPKTQVLPLTLDAAGALRVAVDKLPVMDHPALLTAELEYPDANGERLTATGRVRLNPAAIHLGIRREGWTGTPEQLRFKVVALDLDGRPVPKQELRVTLYRVSDYSYRRRLIGGFYAYETTRETVKLAAGCAGRSDARGQLVCEVAPGVSGQIVLRAETRDRGGLAAGATASMWVVGEDEWWFGGTAGDRMDLLAERPEYEAGQKARFQVRMPFRKATALVTVEREGVLSGFVRRLSGRSPIVEVPIAGSHAPNVFVAVLAVRGRVPHAAGRPARAADGEVTALVDLSKPAFRLGMAKIRVGWRRQRLDVQVTPERSVYRAGEQARVQLRVRRADGGALPAGGELALAAVDEGLLELAPNRSWNLLESMMQPRGLEVSTATAQMQVVGKRHYGRKAVPQGGGGGRDRARSSFDSLLLWQARVPLDAEGRATVTVPLNDSLTSFRLVAVAQAGAELFGTGAANLTTTQDLMLMSGLPPLVREGDRFLATFTLRNTTDRALRATLTAAVSPAPAAALAPREVELAPGAAADVAWSVVTPVAATQLDWDLRLALPDGSRGDRLKVSQQVLAAVPVRTWQATLEQLEGPLALPIAQPAGALPGRGGIEVGLRAKLADGLDGVRDYMSAYPYTCIEQNLSRAVALGDRPLWDRWMARLPAYLDRDGLVKYFASEALPGEDSLTAYVLAIADAAGFAVPDAERARMIEGLTGFVQGRIVRDSALPTADLAVRKLAAIAALARHGAAQPAMLESLALEPEQWPTSAVLDWLEILKRIPAVKSPGPRRDAALGILRARLNFQGTTLGFATERRDALWWLMISTDTNAARLLLAVLERPEWQADVPRLVRGLLGRQQRGHWNTTVANAWGTLAMRRFSAAFEATPVTGSTAVALGTTRYAVQWPNASGAGGIGLLWPEGRETLHITHTGGGRPWALVQAKAALPLAAPLATGFAIERTLTPVEQRVAGRWSRGDVVRMRLEIEAQSDMSWVVVDDPVPAGSSILGSGLGGQSERLTRNEAREGFVWPAFEERRFDAFRAYYRFVPKGRWTVEYTLRLNNPGTFQLPATRVEAMYAPEMLGERPNAPFIVEAP